MPDAQTTTDATSTTDTNATAATTATDQTAELGDGGQKALAEERRLRKEAEKQAKANATELQKLRDANLNEVDKAILAAREEGKTEALREAGIGRVEDAVRAAAGGRNVDVDALLESLDPTKFLDDAGGPDREAIQAWVDRIAPAAGERGDGFGVPDLAQGTRTPAKGLGSDELTNALARMVGARR